MTALSVCGIAILACVLCVVCYQNTQRFGRFVSIAASLLILGLALSGLARQWESLASLFSLGVYGSLFAVLGKAMGVALLVETTADICRDVGEELLSARLLFFGKVEILMLSIPLMRDLIALMGEVML